mmetsp:Transcript_5588/g.12257  ORF Transcript_5588/g.12257 Transcript_5588/m.12257 type:complete len:397 (+) Transcript_5588:137-1327(+)
MEGRARIQGSAFELRMVLAPDIVRVLRPRQLRHLHARPRLIASHELQTRVVDGLHPVGINLITMPVALRHDCGVLVHDLRHGGAPVVVSRVRERRVPRPESHGPAHVLLVDLRHEDDDGVFGFLVEFGGVGVFPLQDVARILHDHGLEAQADSQVRHGVLAAEFRGQDFSVESSGSESPWNNDAISALYFFPGFLVLFLSAHLLIIKITLEVSRFHPDQVQLTLHRHARMLQTFDHAQIRILQSCVFSHNQNLDGLLEPVQLERHSRPIDHAPAHPRESVQVLLPAGQRLHHLLVRHAPLAEVPHRGLLLEAIHRQVQPPLQLRDTPQLQLLGQDPMQVLLHQQQRDVVHVAHVVHAQHALGPVDVTEARDLALRPLFQNLPTPAEYDRGAQSYAP